jgi:hypothetical protein
MPAPDRLQPGAGAAAKMGVQKALTSMRQSTPREASMNSIIYIVGLVVIIGVILSYFGFR